ncbi:uncharacterized protein CLUP02_12283 [Colletotrichum lupini]|uniref:Uncharacterized protein n=1 Tax=Colletotrichum lupini TaxID=145971 RepID=A0A9Q8WKM6_9PEZI|nr:uncharacterized protein CLUP02_12283 [Colletotrichum lupini]UQC86781.1 hypothetical protein CLUP02_12283 [Colletotrichum lupini]
MRFGRRHTSGSKRTTHTQIIVEMELVKPKTYVPPIPPPALSLLLLSLSHSRFPIGSNHSPRFPLDGDLIAMQATTCLCHEPHRSKLTCSIVGGNDKETRSIDTTVPIGKRKEGKIPSSQVGVCFSPIVLPFSRRNTKLVSLRFVELKNPPFSQSHRTLRNANTLPENRQLREETPGRNLDTEQCSRTSRTAAGPEDVSIDRKTFHISRGSRVCGPESCVTVSGVFVLVCRISRLRANGRLDKYSSQGMRKYPRNDNSYNKPSTVSKHSHLYLEMDRLVIGIKWRCYQNSEDIARYKTRQTPQQSLTGRYSLTLTWRHNQLGHPSVCISPAPVDSSTGTSGHFSGPQVIFPSLSEHVDSQLRAGSVAFSLSTDDLPGRVEPRFPSRTARGRPETLCGIEAVKLDKGAAGQVREILISIASSQMMEPLRPVSPGYSPLPPSTAQEMVG